MVILMRFIKISSQIQPAYPITGFGIFLKITHEIYGDKIDIGTIEYFIFTYWKNLFQNINRSGMNTGKCFILLPQF
jgi:hypothetical protein